MNNEIGRKITSLTLMTIMLAGGMIVAVPSMVPAAHAANANLFVSAENSQFNNYMSGPQVIEVVVIDSDINDTDEAKGEPDVTVNGKILRMVQAVDGNWYGYFADRNMALIADSTASGPGVGLNFGTFCHQTTKYASITGSATFFTDTVGIAIPNTLDSGQLVGTNPPVAINSTATCQESGVSTGTNGTGAMQVVREAKNVNAGSTTVLIGQIGLNSTSTGIWPFIQLYALNPTGNVVIQYNKGGGVQTTTLTFDTVDQFAGASLDATKYTRSAQIHTTITDLWLNIDPTDEDSWTFGANAANNTSTTSGFGSYYQVFDENGVNNGAASGNGLSNIRSSLSDLMCEDNCLLRVNANQDNAANPVLTLQDNDDSVLVLTGAGNNIGVNNATAFTVNSLGATQPLGEGSVPVTVTEQGPNSGIFGTYDESDKSVLKITSTAARGTSATIDYNETPVTVLVGFNFATVDIQPTDAEWTSGEEIPVVIVDGDANRNSRADEDLDLNNVDTALIPALSTGDPYTLAEAGLATNATRAVWIRATSFNGTQGDPSSVLFTGQVGFITPNASATLQPEKFSERSILNTTANQGIPVNALIIDLGTDIGELRKTIRDPTASAGTFHGFNFLNLDVRSLNNTGTYDVYLLNTTGTNIINPTTGNIANQSGTQVIGTLLIADNVNPQSLTLLNGTGASNTALFETTNTQSTNRIGLMITSSAQVAQAGGAFPDTFDAIAVDFLSFGYINDGLEDNQRIANQIVRIEAEETGDNTSTFAGSLEFIMINQINILDRNTYLNLSPIANDATFIVIEDLDDEESPRVNYNDLGADGVTTQVADQQAAGSHSGVVSLDASSYKTADTVTITLEDLDLNVDSDLVDIYTTITNFGTLFDVVGRNSTSTVLSNADDLGRILDITFDDQKWTTPFTGTSCRTALTNAGVTDTGLGATGFTLVESGAETGIFVGDFQIPAQWCRTTSGELVTASESVTGLDIEVNYVDFRDASGEVVEVGDGAGVRANTGSVSLDRTVYPVPFGVPSDFTTSTTITVPQVSTSADRSVFPIHQTGTNTAGTSRSSANSGTGTQGLDAGEFIANGDLILHVRVNDPDFNTSAAGEDFIGQNTTATTVGPVKISVLRGSSSVVLGYAGGDSILLGPIDVADNNRNATRQFGPMEEISPDAGIFESDIVVRYTDGPADSKCPATNDFTVATAAANTATNAVTDRFDVQDATNANKYCILQGDILQVQYTDPADASGDVNTVTDSATFDLRNGVLQSDKSVYIIGSDMILTLIEPDFDLNNDQAETYDLDLIEWDSDAATLTMGDADGAAASFDPEPFNFRETGDNTGIFQIVIEIPDTLSGDKLERGEEIVLEYSDWGPSGSDFVGDEDEDVNLTLFTSNFGATVELDQKVYTWTDKVYITIVAPCLLYTSPSPRD